jgi:hypothetical protein
MPVAVIPDPHWFRVRYTNRIFFLWRTFGMLTRHEQIIETRLREVASAH